MRIMWYWIYIAGMVFGGMLLVGILDINGFEAVVVVGAIGALGGAIAVRALQHEVEASKTRNATDSTISSNTARHGLTKLGREIASAVPSTSPDIVQFDQHDSIRLRRSPDKCMIAYRSHGGWFGVGIQVDDSDDVIAASEPVDLKVAANNIEAAAGQTLAILYKLWFDAIADDTCNPAERRWAENALRELKAAGFIQ